MPDYAGEKTLDPTPHRRQQARREGHVAKSHDLGSAAMFLAGIAVLMMPRRRPGGISGRLLPQPTRRHALAHTRHGILDQPQHRDALGAGPLSAADPRADLSGRSGGQRAAGRGSFSCPSDWASISRGSIRCKACGGSSRQPASSSWASASSSCSWSSAWPAC